MTTTAETAAQCDKCGCTTIAPELLISVLRPFRWPRQSRRVCPRCLARAERRAVAVISGLFLATAVPVAVAWRCGRFEPDPMADHLMTFAWMCTVVTILNPLLIAAHELAHALVGCCVGLRVFRISLGSGVCLIRRRLAGVALEVHGLPWGGF